jgi:hypothetical protein
MEKVKSSGLGKLTSWSPQQSILNHPVLYSYFFTCPGSVLTTSGNWMVHHPQWF